MSGRWRPVLLMFVLLSGCSDNISNTELLKPCNDGPEGVYYVKQDEMCCGGVGVEMSDDNCGRCGDKCVDGNHCFEGVCTCAATGLFCPLLCAPTGCVDPMTNPDYCGGLDNSCDTEAGEVCSNGECDDRCRGESRNCGGICTDTDNDARNCGGCGTECAKLAGANVQRSYCLGGECRYECATGYFDIDGVISNGCESRVNYKCGNGMVEYGEMCDGGSLNDKTCEDVVGNGSRGTLRCRPDCLGFDASRCSAPTTCGDGIINGAEVCDGRNLGGQTCATVVGEGSEGYLACEPKCLGFDTTYCSAATTCGNGKIDGTEVCDGKWLNGATCESVVGKGSEGALRCSDNCSNFDITGCSAPSKCGNGQIDRGEECDGTVFAASDGTCAGAGFEGSTEVLLCTGECRVNDVRCRKRECDGDDIECVIDAEGRQSVRLCMEGIWNTAYDCGKSKVCRLKPDENGKIIDGECVDPADGILDVSWCNFQSLDAGSGHRARGRIQLPEGKGTDDVLAYMACTSDLSVPVDGWDVIEAEAVGDCEDCGGSTEYATVSDYAGKAGMNYCTFIFDFMEEGIFACRPVVSGESKPVVLSGDTVVGEEFTRTFSVTLVSYRHIETMNSWYTKDRSDYNTTTPKSATYQDGSKLTVSGAFWLSDHTIDGVTNVQRGSKNTWIRLEDLSAGLGMFGFDYRIWGDKEKDVVLSIGDGNTVKELVVSSADTEVAHFEHKFDNGAATVAEIRPDSGSDGRVLIDNIYWTSAD